MVDQPTSMKMNRGLKWVFTSILLLLFTFSLPVQAQIPGCNSTMKDLLRKVPPIPGARDLQNTVSMASELAGMSDDDLYTNLDRVGEMLDGIDPGAMVDQLNNLDKLMKDPTFETASILGGSLEGLMGQYGLPDLDGKLRKAFEEMERKRQSEQDPAKRAQLEGRMEKIRGIIEKRSEIEKGYDKAQKDLTEMVEGTDVYKDILTGKDVLDKINDPTLLEGDINKHLESLENLDMDKIRAAKDRVDQICSLLPAFGDLRGTIITTIDSYANGALDKAKDELTELVGKGIDAVLKNLPDGPIKDALKGAVGDLANGDINSAKKKLKNTGINTALDKLGGLQGAAGKLGSALGLLCLRPKPIEEYDCPEVDCDPSPLKKGVSIVGGQFKKRVEEYFKYEPPKNNRAAYLNDRNNDFEINKDGEHPRAPAYRMNEPNCHTVPNKQVNEACQDNRWRDTCLLGPVVKDKDYLFKVREELRSDEEPFPGVAGASPIYDPKSPQLNCLVPKNTERTSPLNFDHGWRYRDMCPGNQKLWRVERDKTETALDILRGDYGCLSPLPKCNIKNDWLFGSINWKNQEYKSYSKAFGTLIGSVIGSVTGGLLGNKSDIYRELKATLTTEQFDNIKKLFDPKNSPAAECKPAYWVRLMLDSCANQYILNKSMKPGYIFNNDGGKHDGYSPRHCQPFSAKNTDVDSLNEYNVAEYLKRAHNGLLREDYMPWIQYDRHKGKKFNKAAKRHRADQWPERKIKWKGKAKREHRKSYRKIPPQLSLKDYIKHPVERIVDPSHPFSPRYDTATLINGLAITDRTLFGKETESQALPLTAAKVAGLEKYWCVPKNQTGYWEFGCTIYCSAVEVDLLRFRYKDYRLCMGCQIDTNEKAFWRENNLNSIYYSTTYCLPPVTHPDCEYGNKAQKEVCGACGRATLWWGKYSYHMAQYSANIASCNPLYNPAACAQAAYHMAKAIEAKKRAITYSALCPVCMQGARAEALERTRERTNEVKEPKWGPTAVGDNWPVCSTRFDHEGDKKLCKEAKEKYTCEKQAKKTEKDENIAEKEKNTKKDTEQCIKKDIEDICHGAAKPVYSVNFLKIRTRKGDFRTDQSKGKFLDLVNELRTGGYADEDPAEGNGFREYFGNKRPYMRWWDTGKEAFQVKQKPDYWCDWGQNDAIMGVGRDYNSIHGRKAQLCRYGGGGSIGDGCFTMQKWKDGANVPNGQKFTELAGSEWAELKLYQANCFREKGLNCLCQYEKTFKDQGSEDHVLAAMGGVVPLLQKTVEDPETGEARLTRAQNYQPLAWRGYISTPAHRDTLQSAPAVGSNQQFPHLFGDPKSGSMIRGGLDKARPGDIAIFPAGTGVMPYVALVVSTNTVNDYADINLVPSGSQWVRLSDTNNGKYPDACGNTSFLGRGQPRWVYPSQDQMPEAIQNLMKDQIAATMYCDDPELGHCVERRWKDVVLYRPNDDERRD